jgi:hypothetical protein
MPKPHLLPQESDQLNPITPKVKMLSKENTSTINPPAASFPSWYSKTAPTMIRIPNTTAIAPTTWNAMPSRIQRLISSSIPEMPSALPCRDRTMPCIKINIPATRDKANAAVVSLLLFVIVSIYFLTSISVSLIIS